MEAGTVKQKSSGEEGQKKRTPCGVRFSEQPVRSPFYSVVSDG